MTNRIFLNGLKSLIKTILKPYIERLPNKKGSSLLDQYKKKFKGTTTGKIDFRSILPPSITIVHCIVEPEIVKLTVVPCYTQIITCQNSQCLQNLRMQVDELAIGKQLTITCPSCHQIFKYSQTREDLIEDVTERIKKIMFCPEIESFSLSFDTPLLVGKLYQQLVAEEDQTTLFDKEEKDEDCIHGLKKSWCFMCLEKRKQEIRERRTPFSGINPFDLIFPILQPPLGEDFDDPIAFPPGLRLFPFQREGVRFLASHERALLGDEMGLGKSIQAIVAIRFLIHNGTISDCLILCPKSVLTDWEKKLHEWAPELRILKIRGVKEQREISWNSPAHIYLTTYETLRQDLCDLSGSYEAIRNSDGSYDIKCPDARCSEKFRIDGEMFGVQLQCPTCNNVFTYTPTKDIARKKIDFIILDEVQKVKNPGADITKVTRQIDAPIRWGLSGTPLENRIEELISIFAYLKPGLLHYGDERWPSKVKEAIKPYFLRRRKADVLPDLPAKVCEEVWLELLPAQRIAYNRAEVEGKIVLNELGDSITIQHIFALITKLKQICNIDPLTKESCKLEYLLEKLGDISERGNKTLVFSQYPEKTLKFLESELSQFNPSVYHGSLSESQRDKIVKEFQEKEHCKVLLMSVKAGGLGLTLTSANFVFHFDLWWNPAIAAQAEDRTHRIGQKKKVFVTSLFTADTIEERIQNLLRKKRKLFNEVIDDLSDTNLTKVLTEEELFSLFNLKKAKSTTYKGDD